MPWTNNTVIVVEEIRNDVQLRNETTPDLQRQNSHKIDFISPVVPKCCEDGVCERHANFEREKIASLTRIQDKTSEHNFCKRLEVDSADSCFDQNYIYKPVPYG